MGMPQHVTARVLLDSQKEFIYAFTSSNVILCNLDPRHVCYLKEERRVGPCHSRGRHTRGYIQLNNRDQNIRVHLHRPKEKISSEKEQEGIRKVGTEQSASGCRWYETP